MFPSPISRALHFLAGGAFAAWLPPHAPPSSLLELVEALRLVREIGLTEPVPAQLAVPLLEALLGHPWLHGRYMPLAVHEELEAADDFLVQLAQRS